MKWMWILDLTILVFIMGMSFLVGLYLGVNQYHGFWTKDIMGFEGNWVHININGIDFEKAMSICRHEVGHEMFAEYCEESPENFENCVEATKK